MDTTLAALAEAYDGFLVDQFGVLLDGTAAYPFAPAALAALHATGKPVILLSNSGRRSAPNADRLSRLGIPETTYTGILTSGETAHAALARRIGDSISPGSPVLILSRYDDVAEIAGLDLTATDYPDKAALILLAGSRGESVSLDHYRDLLEGPARRRTPCLCTNPDMSMLTANGLSFGAGRIATLYEDMGGPVEWYGKPHAAIYHEVARRLPDIPADRILAIGDSPAHDIRGGRAAGHATALVRTGIHAGELLPDLLATCPPGDRPDHVIPRFEI